MGLFNAIGIASSSMVANRLWLDVIANNIANANTTRTESGEPFRKRSPIFSEMLNKTDMAGDSGFMNAGFDESGGEADLLAPGNGVKVVDVYTDSSPFKLVYNPGHPDADKTTGFVKMPSVSATGEMVDMMSSNRAYDASVQVVNTAKAMVTKALEIGK